MEETTMAMPMAASVDQRAQQDAPKRAEDQEGVEEEEGDEMPLLFMDRLPSDFTSNAQLAAIATFMDDSDTEQQQRDDGDGDDDESDDAAAYSRAPSTCQKKKRVAKRVRKQAPYAKKTNPKSRGDASSAKELQLYLSMFKM